MERTLNRINVLAIPLLTVLCVVQWWKDRELQLRLEESRSEVRGLVELQARLEGQLESARADLRLFKERYHVSEERSAELRRELDGVSRERDRLEAELGRLREVLTNWMEAVRLRDEKLEAAAGTIRELNQRVGELADRYRNCVTNYERLVVEHGRLLERHRRPGTGSGGGTGHGGHRTQGAAEVDVEPDDTSP